MDKVEYKGKTYLFTNGKWLTSEYITVPTSIIGELNKLIEGDVNLEAKSVDELIDMAKQARLGNNYQLAQKVLLTAMESAKTNEVRLILPMITSNLRLLGRPKEAIDYSAQYIKSFSSSISSSALFTSIGAAYADLDEFDLAKKYADKAYAISNGKGSSELMGLYGRIKKEIGE